MHSSFAVHVNSVEKKWRPYTMYGDITIQSGRERQRVKLKVKRLDRRPRDTRVASRLKAACKRLFHAFLVRKDQ